MRLSGPAADNDQVHLTPASAQLRALLLLRWRMVRSPGVRLGLGSAGLLVVYLAWSAARSAAFLEPAALESAVQLAPAAFLGFAVLAFIAPLTAGGGSEVVPPDQLVAFPVRTSTRFLGGLTLAPLNLVWAVQLVTLTAETAYVARQGNAGRAALTAASYVACVTVMGQTLAWLVTGVRQKRRGRQGVAAVALVLLATAVAELRAGAGHALLAHSPTRAVVRAVAARPGEQGRWATTTAVLLLLTVVSLWAGLRLCGWALRRPADVHHGGESTRVRRRGTRGSAWGELVALNRASAWRAPALRRAALVLAVLPALAVAGTRVPWQSLTVLPGLVAAGAGLLFGVNAFALDASGALWLASLPHDPLLIAKAKARVLAETILVAVLLVLLAGALRNRDTPTASELLSILCSALVCTAVVVAIGMSSSVRRPHHALLSGPRDSIAPPGAMAMASVRISVPAAVLGLLFEAAARAGHVWVPPLLAVPLLALAAGSLRRSLRRYAHPELRARIVAVVSAG